jgi:hypothetical protein
LILFGFLSQSSKTKAVAALFSVAYARCAGWGDTSARRAKARTLPAWKGYITNVAGPSPAFVIGAYRRLFRIEASFRCQDEPVR